MPLLSEPRPSSLRRLFSLYCLSCRWSLLLGLVLIAVVLCSLPAQAKRTTMMSVKPETATLYQQPSAQSRVLGTLPRDYPVRVVSKRGGWRKVTDFVGWQGWVRQADLVNTKTVVVTRNLVNIRQRPSFKARIVLKAKRYVTFLLLKSQGAWLQVKHRDGEVGWLHRNVVWGD